MKDSKATIKYSILKILFPLISIITVPFSILLLMNLIGANVDAKWSVFEIIFDFTKVNSYIYQGIVFVLLILFYRFLILSKFLNEKKLYDGDFYGSYKWIWYVLAKIIGYNRISLVRKPFKISLLIQSKGYFEIVEDHKDEELAECKHDIDFTITIREGSKDQINIVISDTYPILETYIPVKFSSFHQFTFNRITKKQTRVYAKEFIDEVGKVINEYKEQKIKINLFMTTSISNTSYLFNNYIMLGDRQYVYVEIFQMVDKPTRRFLENGFIYKRGQNYERS